MNRRICQMALGAVLAIPLSGVLASPALAETVVMGSTLANDFDSPGQGISAPTVSAQFAFDPGTSPNPVVSPANGVITGWKVKSADDGALYTLKILRPTGPVSVVPPNTSDFTAIASVAAPSAIPAGTAVGTPTGKIFDYPASLPIGKGDYIGVLASGAVSDIPQHTTSGIPANVTANNFAGEPAGGAPAPLQADEQHDLLLQATVKFCKVPNLQGKKLKAAKKALAAADCAAKVSKKKGAKKKQRGKVIKQKKKAGFTAPPGTQIPIVVGKK